MRFDMRHFEFEISQFIDNELPLSEKKELFLHLSQCDECNLFLEQSLKMKTEVKSYYSRVKPEGKPLLKVSNVSQPDHRKTTIYKMLFYTSVAATIILGFFLILISKDLSYFKSNIPQMHEEITALRNDLLLASREQGELLNIGKNQLAQKNNLIIHPTDKKPHVKKTPAVHFVIKTNNSGTGNYMIQYATIPSVKINKEDFLIPPIIGN